MGFVELNIGEKKYFIKELTTKDVREYLKKTMKKEFTVDGNIIQYFDTAEFMFALLSVCVYVEDGGNKRVLKENEIDELPYEVSKILLEACMKANPSLLEGFQTPMR